ncbi:MAG: hypothetical protein E7036_09435 [Opitutales bacterium]|nr:hypothetical protein [Opitutales bacterium]
MKKKLSFLTIICTLATASAFATATDLVGSPSVSPRKPFTDAGTTGLDLNLVPPENTATGTTLYYIGTAVNVSKITTTEGYKYNIANGFTLDTNTAGSAVGIQDNSTSLTFANPTTTASPTGALTVKNSAGNYETIINSNKLVIAQTNPVGTRTNAVQVHTDLTVNAKDFQVTCNIDPQKAVTFVEVQGSRVLKIKGGTFTLGANALMKGFLASTIDLQSVSTISGTINLNGYLKINENTTVENGGTVLFRSASNSKNETGILFGEGKTITFNSGSSLVLGGNSSAANDKSHTQTFTNKNVVFNGGNLQVQGGWDLNYDAPEGTDVSKTNINLGSLTLGGLNTSSVMTSGAMKVGKYNRVQAKNVVINQDSFYEGYGAIDVKDGGSITLEEGSGILLQDIDTGVSNRGRIILRSNSTVNINGVSSLSRIDANGNTKNGVLLAITGATTFNVNADVSFGTIANSSASTMTINLLNDLATFKIADMESTLNENARIVVNNFQNDRVYFGGDTIQNYLDRFVLQDANGNLLNGAISINNGWLTLTAVPEPAEWAMIFGAIALGLAVYRRRK